MANYFKDALKVFISYGASVFIFVFLSYPFFKYLAIYSFVIFLLMFAMVYGDMHKLAVKEKRPQYNIVHYPLKGLVIGLIGFLPFILVQLIAPFINIQAQVINFQNLKDMVIKVLLSPMFFILKLGGKTTVSYVIATAVVPVIAMLGYLAGYYGFELRILYRKLFGRKNKTKDAGNNSRPNMNNK